MPNPSSTSTIRGQMVANGTRSITGDEVGGAFAGCVRPQGVYAASTAYFWGDLVWATDKSAAWLCISTDYATGVTGVAPPTLSSSADWLGPFTVGASSSSGGTGGGPSGGTAPPAPASASRTLWLDASALSGLSDGDALTAWADAGGNGNGVAQSAGSRQPTYRTGVVNGRPVVRFDATDDGMYGGPSLADPSDKWAIFAVLRPVSPPAGSPARAVQNGNGAATGDLWMGADGSGHLVGYGNGGGAISNVSTAYAAGTAYCCTLYFDGANGNYHFRVNGADQTQYTGDSGTPGAISLGAAGQSAQPFGGDVAEIVFYDGDVTPTEVSAVESYLSSKWGLGF